jgi:hypothetical protein
VWLAEYERETAAKARYMQPQALADMLWAMACFNASPDEAWLAQAAAAVVEKAGGLSPGAAGVAVWALQRLGLKQGSRAWGQVGADQQLHKLLHSGAAAAALAV